MGRMIFLFKLCLRLAIVVVIAWGLFIDLYSAFGAFQSWQLLYYTNLSNLAVMLLFIYLIVKALRNKQETNQASYRQYLPSSEQLKMALTWAISITGIVWHIALAPALDEHIAQGGKVIQALPASFDMVEFMLSVSLLHTWSPLLVFLDWLLFSPKKRLPLYTPLTWLLIPLGYFAFICAWVQGIGPVNAELHITYPYPFIDFSAYPATQIGCNIAIIAVGAVVLGYIYWGINWLLGKIFSKHLA